MSLGNRAFFDAHDLGVCQKAFDSVCHEVAISKESEEAGQIAEMIIELYRQGVHSAEHLSIMAGAARGLLNK